MTELTADAAQASAMNFDKTLLDVRDLKVHFPIGGGLLSRGGGAIKAVDGVSFTIHRGETLGLVSFGSIPRLVARQAQAFDLRVIAHDPFVPAETMREHGVEPVELDELFRQADFVSVHTPLSPATFHLVKEQQFRLMKPTAYFINTSRGKVVDEPALIRALQEGWIAADINVGLAGVED